jgi:hypothetical protein
MKPIALQTLHNSGTTQLTSEEEKSPIQTVIAKLVGNIPPALFKFVPGVGEQLSKITQANHEEAFIFVHGLYEQVGDLLEKDREWSLRHTGQWADNGSREDPEREEHANGQPAHAVPEQLL